MTTFHVIPSREAPRTWRELYKAAIFETDPSKISLRILQAERALVLRERELFLSSQNEVELNAVNAALQKLDTLRRCLNTTARYQQIGLGFSDQVAQYSRRATGTDPI